MKLLVVKLLISIVVSGCFLYSYIHQRNALTALQLTLPTLEKELRELEQQNINLQYAIDRFESPLHLMELLRKPEYGHLKYPHLDEITVIGESKGEEDA